MGFAPFRRLPPFPSIPGPKVFLLFPPQNIVSIPDMHKLLWSEAIFAATAKNAVSTYQCWPDCIWFNVLHGRE